MANAGLEGFYFFHNLLIVLIFSLLVLVLSVLLLAFKYVFFHWACLWNPIRFLWIRSIFFVTRDILKWSPLENYWTIIPMFIILFLFFPTYSLLQSLLSAKENFYHLHFIASQWNWEVFASSRVSWWVHLFALHSFFSQLNPSFPLADSNFSNFYALQVLIDNPSILKGFLRKLEVSEPIGIPLYVPVSVSTTSTDVNHALSIPQLALKMDAIPSRLNEVSVNVGKGDILFGQCSELCGAGHADMPIKLYALEHIKIIPWASSSSYLKDSDFLFYNSL